MRGEGVGAGSLIPGEPALDDAERFPDRGEAVARDVGRVADKAASPRAPPRTTLSETEGATTIGAGDAYTSGAGGGGGGALSIGADSSFSTGEAPARGVQRDGF